MIGALRWILPDNTTTDAPILQYRDDSMQYKSWSEWKTVPLEVVTQLQFDIAKDKP